MFSRTALFRNSVLQWLWNHGWEEPVDPLGPFNQQFGPQPEPWRLDINSGYPVPWRVAVPQLVAAVQARDLAARLEGNLKDAATRSATLAIDSILDDWCGTPPRKWPWPWPGPPPWTWEIASELTLVANSLQSGSLKEGLLEVAAQVVRKATGAG
jgi:hypothetical protein